MAGILDGVNQRTQLVGRNRLELLLFRLGGQQKFGINVFKVQEVIQCPALTQVPHSGYGVRGIANMRGKTIPVMDLAMAMGMRQLASLEDAFVIITEFNRKTIGFAVSAVDRIINMNWEDILPPPKGMSRGTYLTAVTRVNDELVEIIDVEKVLEELVGSVVEVPQEMIASAAEDVAELNPLVLVADDSSVARNQIQRTLDQLGIETVLVNDGKQALDKLLDWQANSPEVFDRLAMLLSDIEMPEMDGYTLTTEIRNNPNMHSLFIMLHSSLSGVFNNAMVEKVGADFFIPKFKPEELAAEVVKRVEAFKKQHSAG